MKKYILIISSLLICVLAHAQEEEITPSQQTGIIFKSTTYNFGEIEYGSDEVAEFEFKNMSDEPIVLTNVIAKCGCTNPEWPREPIRSKQRSKISISYDTTKKGKFSKSIYVYHSGSKHPVQLWVKGNVLSPEEKK